jgi:four helix bundle protein
MSNIGEEFEIGTHPQFVDFLGTAKASTGEVRCQLYVERNQGYLDEDEFEAVTDLADKVSRQLYHPIRHLDQCDGSDYVRELPPEYIADS